MKFVKKIIDKVQEVFSRMSIDCKLSTVIAIFLFVIYVVIQIVSGISSSRKNAQINDSVDSIYEKTEESINAAIEKDISLRPLEKILDTKESAKGLFEKAISIIYFVITGIVWGIFEGIRIKMQKDVMIKSKEDGLYNIPRAIYALLEFCTLLSSFIW